MSPLKRICHTNRFKSSLTNSHLCLILADRYKNNFSLGNLDDDARSPETFRLDIDVDRYRAIADTHGFCIKTDQIADKYRLVKNDLFHRNGHKAVVPRMPDRFNAAGDIDITQNNPAKYGTMSIRIPRHHRQANRRVAGSIG